NISPGDQVIGLGSNGLHTNGFSLARRILFEAAGLSSQSTPEILGGQTVGDALMATHRCYSGSVLPILDEFEIKGMAHITGGGFYDNIPRILPSDCNVTVDRLLWRIPPIFSLIQELGKVPDSEMFRAFNMGIGYVLIVGRDQASEIVARLVEAGESAG